MKFYTYKNCGTCVKAKKYLESKSIDFSQIPIREQPPTIVELKQMLTKYHLTKLFNSSGQDYRKLNIKDKLASMGEKQAIEMLSKNGNLVKRPFVIGKNILLVGFKEDEWDNYF